MSELLPCPCCGSPVIHVRGAFEICPVCQWEDDPAQARDPELAGGANGMSLSAARLDWKMTARRRT
ncbi:MAG: CPCC family cysteine-rich protein [Rhizomicrobium sp.]